jgi:hypothetical protein
MKVCSFFVWSVDRFAHPVVVLRATIRRIVAFAPTFARFFVVRPQSVGQFEALGLQVEVGAPILDAQLRELFVYIAALFPAEFIKWDGDRLLFSLTGTIPQVACSFPHANVHAFSANSCDASLAAHSDSCLWLRPLVL